VGSDENGFDVEKLFLSSASPFISGTIILAVISSISMRLSGMVYLRPIIIIITNSMINEDLLSLRLKPNQFLIGSRFEIIFKKMQ
jgi:hypothetical protein